MPVKKKTKKKIGKSSKPLSAKHKLFCKEYLVDLNATQAYIRTGYAPKTAEVCACKLLTNAKVKAEIKALMSKREKKLDIDAEYVLRNLKEIAEDCKKAENKETQAINAFSWIGKHLKMFTDKIEVEAEQRTLIINRPPPRKKEKK